MNENGNAMNLNLHPQLDEKWVTVRRQDNGLWKVHVRVFKLNTLRGDSYWNTLALRTYQKKADAERYAKRFGWGVANPSSGY
jgi:hypothetical protein